MGRVPRPPPGDGRGLDRQQSVPGHHREDAEGAGVRLNVQCGARVRRDNQRNRLIYDVTNPSPEEVGVLQQGSG